jgi:hypothetical protein
MSFGQRPLTTVNRRKKNLMKDHAIALAVALGAAALHPHFAKAADPPLAARSAHAAPAGRLAPARELVADNAAPGWHAADGVSRAH